MKFKSHRNFRFLFLSSGLEITTGTRPKRVSGACQGALHFVKRALDAHAFWEVSQLLQNNHSFFGVLTRENTASSHSWPQGIITNYTQRFSTKTTKGHVFRRVYQSQLHETSELGWNFTLFQIYLQFVVPTPIK